MGLGGLPGHVSELVQAPAVTHEPVAEQVALIVPTKPPPQVPAQLALTPKEPPQLVKVAPGNDGDPEHTAMQGGSR